MQVFVFVSQKKCNSWVPVFANGKILKIMSLLISVPPKKKNKKKTVESSDIWLIFLSRSMEKQAGHYGKTGVIDWF